MRKIIIATHNRDKFREMSEGLEGLNWEPVPAYDFPDIPVVEEDGMTLEVNSLKKAKAVSDFTRLAALADDTGLFVPALNGQPGVLAARFAGEGCTYADNVRKLLEMMKGIPPEKRDAIFQTLITLYYPDRPYQQVSGVVKGFITLSPRGEAGFGYDPVFQPVGFSKVFSEMTLDEKNEISHRGKAILAARKLLNN